MSDSIVVVAVLNGCHWKMWLSDGFGWAFGVETLVNCSEMIRGVEQDDDVLNLFFDVVDLTCEIEALIFT